MVIKEIIPTEYWEQAELFKWKASYRDRYPELWLMHGSLNGVRLSIGQAMKCKRIGMTKGWPDVSLPVARQGFCGLFIELKRRKGGRVEKEQAIIHKLLRAEGNRVEVCKGYEEAVGVLIDYLTKV
jgi:hypothetical protein